MIDNASHFLEKANWKTINFWDMKIDRWCTIGEVQMQSVSCGSFISLESTVCFTLHCINIYYFLSIFILTLRTSSQTYFRDFYTEKIYRKVPFKLKELNRVSCMNLIFYCSLDFILQHKNKVKYTKLGVDLYWLTFIGLLLLRYSRKKYT